MEELGSNDIQMELKYCERCGGLWLRLKGSEVIYCPSCLLALAGGTYRNLCGEAGDGLEASFMQSGNATFWGEGGNA